MFRQAREARGLTKYRLAKESGVSESLVGKIEAGKTVPEEETLKKLEPVLGLPVSEMKAWAELDRLGGEKLETMVAQRELWLAMTTKRLDVLRRQVSDLEGEFARLSAGPKDQSTEKRLAELEAERARLRGQLTEEIAKTRSMLDEIATLTERL